MKLPNSANAVIPPEKLFDYLLSQKHPIGRFKANFFRKLGFNPNNWRDFETALRDLLMENAELVEGSSFGQKYLIRGDLSGPSGQSARIVTVWIILGTDDRPRFVTAYPED